MLFLLVPPPVSRFLANDQRHPREREADAKKPFDANDSTVEAVAHAPLPHNEQNRSIRTKTQPRI